MAPKLFDTHMHLLDRRFDSDRERIIGKFEADGIRLAVECATDIQEAKRAAALAAQYCCVYAAAGVHPHNAKDAKDGYLDQLAELLKKPKVKALGEIGLDYHYGFSPKEQQKKVFDEQLKLAKTLKMPVIVHSREAAKDTMDILKRYRGNVSALLHCFSGSVETALRYVEWGFYISFSGTLTFGDAVKVKEAAKAVPADRIMAETDCPYLAPEPKRGKRNEPKYVRFVLREMAGLKEKSYEAMADINFRNGCRFYHIDEDSV